MLNLSPPPVIGWDNCCSECLHPQWLCGCPWALDQILFEVLCKSILMLSKWSAWISLGVTCPCPQRTFLSWLWVLQLWWHSQTTHSLAVRTRTLIWPSSQLGYLVHWEIRKHEQMPSSSVRLTGLFLVPYMELSIQVPSSEKNESNHDSVFSATLKISFMVWFRLVFF